MNVIGDVEGRTCIIQDDIIDTAGTIQKAAQALKDNGAGARAGVRGARRAVGAGDRADREVADRQADRDQHDPARRRPAQRAARSWCCRWRGCWGRRSGAFTRRRRSRRCSCRSAGLRTVETDRIARGSIMEATLEAVDARHVRARTRRGALRARRAGSGGASTARDRTASAEATAIAVDPKALLQDPALRVGRQHADHAEARRRRRRARAGQGVSARPGHARAAARRLLSLAMDKVLRVTVPVVAQGRAEGRQAAGRHARFVPREIEVECLPADIPEHIDVDVTELMLHQGDSRARHRRRTEVEAGHRRRHDARARRHAEGRGSRRRRPTRLRRRRRRRPSPRSSRRARRTKKEPTRRRSSGEQEGEDSSRDVKLIVGLGNPGREVRGHAAQRRVQGGRRAGAARISVDVRSRAGSRR